MPERTYTYTHISTEATTGYFACIPDGLAADFAEDIDAWPALAALEACPADSFLHDFILRVLLQRDTRTLLQLLPNPAKNRPVLSALIAEAVLLNTETAGAMPRELNADVLQELLSLTGFPLLAWGLREKRQDIARAAHLLRENIMFHKPVPNIRELNLPAGWFDAAADGAPTLPTLAELRAGFTPPPPEKRPPAAWTAELALERLLDADALSGPEFRHASSLAPVALFRHWPLEIHVESGSVRYTLTGEGTSWGRGFSIAEARVSCVMEMVERLSAYISVENGEITNRAHNVPIRKATLAELGAKGYAALDPNLLPLGLPYKGQALWWMPAETADGAEMLVPVQAAALFCNLDEPNLLLPPISTGLAAGNTMAEARRAALLEVLERDAEATTPWDESGTFTLNSGDPAVSALLRAYAERRVAVLFRELKTPFGVPCYECSVAAPDGTIVRATAAGMSGRRAALSALTEVPWPFPDSPASKPAPEGIPVRRWEELPDFSTGSAAGDVMLLEQLLSAHGYKAVYAELTRADLQFPVVRALVPGLSLTADTDPWSEPPLRLIRRCAAEKV